MDLLSVYIATSSENAEAVSITSNLQEGKGQSIEKQQEKGNMKIDGNWRFL